jgi:hypothetical protein
MTAGASDRIVQKLIMMESGAEHEPGHFNDDVTAKMLIAS